MRHSHLRVTGEHVFWTVSTSPVHVCAGAVKYDFAIIDIGSNDSANGACPLVAGAIIEAAHTLHRQHLAHHVTICTQLHRTSNTGRLTPNNCNTTIDLFNNIIKNYDDVESHTEGFGHVLQTHGHEMESIPTHRMADGNTSGL